MWQRFIKEVIRTFHILEICFEKFSKTLAEILPHKIHTLERMLPVYKQIILFGVFTNVYN